MLERCLRSLTGQAVPASVEAFILIVDNDPAGSADAVIGRAMTSPSPFPIHARHEPRQGIAIARNAALDAAMRLKADWIAFIDDDEWAEPDWIAGLMAPEYLDVPVLVGPVLTDYAGVSPFWRIEGEVKGMEGQSLKTAYTGNVRFSTELMRAGLRFDEGLGLMGGEDNEMFTRARQAGFEIRRTLKAVVTEAAHPERLTYLALIYRSYWCAASELRRLAITKGWPGALLRKGHTVPLNLLIGAAEIIVSPLCGAFGVDAFKRRALAGGKKIAKAFGRATAMLGILPQPYRVIVGH